MARIKEPKHRPLALDNLRTFSTVARCLSFSAAADELHLTQSAVSRRIQALEDELGVPLFARDTRTVTLTQSGEQLRQSVMPALERIDRTVSKLRIDETRRHVSVTTFSSMATLWLLPRLSSFQAAYPDIDIRIVADDKFLDLDDPEIDVALRYLVGTEPPAHAERMFDETVTAVASPMLVALGKDGAAPRLRTVADLKAHALLDTDHANPGTHCVTWQYYLRERGEADVEPRRRVVINYGHQIIQAAMAGQGVAIGRLPMIQPSLDRGELVEVFGAQARLKVDAAYWLIPMLGAVLRPELQVFLAWLREEAAQTRRSLKLGAAPPKAPAEPRRSMRSRALIDARKS